MAIRISCPSCQATFSLSDALRGKKIRCQQCDKMLSVPAGNSKAAPDVQRGGMNPVVWIAAGGFLLLLLAGGLVVGLRMMDAAKTAADPFELAKNANPIVDIKLNDLIDKANKQDPVKNPEPNQGAKNA